MATGERKRRREERSRRAVAAAVTLAREHGLRVGEPFVLADLFSTMVHLRPAPVVAGVATCMPRLRSPIAPWLERELAVTAYLSERGVPVVAPSPELPPGPHERDGFWVSFWTHLESEPDRIPTADDCSAMLVDLHAALRSYPGALPPLCADDIPRGLELLDRSGDGVLGEADADLLRTSAERLRPLWEAPGDAARPLHGDVHPGNLIATRGGRDGVDRLRGRLPGASGVGPRVDDGRRGRREAPRPRPRADGAMHRAQGAAGGARAGRLPRRLRRHGGLGRGNPGHARHPVFRDLTRDPAPAQTVRLAEQPRGLWVVRGRTAAAPAATG
jgi:hypothetical protein